MITVAGGRRIREGKRNREKEENESDILLSYNLLGDEQGRKREGGCEPFLQSPLRLPGEKGKKKGEDPGRSTPISCVGYAIIKEEGEEEGGSSPNVGSLRRRRKEGEKRAIKSLGPTLHWSGMEGKEKERKKKVLTIRPALAECRRRGGSG